MRSPTELGPAGMDLPTAEPTSPAELTTHSVASRVASILLELDDLIAISREFANPAAQQAVAAEVRALSGIVTRGQLLLSFIESREPRGLRLVGRSRP